MSSRALFTVSNQVKLNPGEIYGQIDPRSYFNTLAPLEYMIPEHAKPVFQKVFDARREARGQRDGHSPTRRTY